jgi:hypothetical protein
MTPPPAATPSPPAPIAHGTATKLGLGGTGALVATALVDALAGNGVDADTRRAITGAIVLAVVTMLIRAAQAIAVELARGRGATLVGELGYAEPAAAHAEAYAGELQDLRAAVKTKAKVATFDHFDHDEGPTDTTAGTEDLDLRDDGDADVDYGHDNIIEAGGGPDDDYDLHDRHDVPRSVKR